MSEGFDFIQGLRFSLFWKDGDNTKNCNPLKVISFEDLISIIMDQALKDISKKERPYFTPYGTFSYRKDSFIQTYNKNLVALDYDKISEDQVNYLDLYWRSRRSTLLSMRSPSGNGLKVLLWAETGIDISKDPEAHYNFLKHNSWVFTILGIDADTSQFVLSQPFFIPYNKDFYFNFHPKKEQYPFAQIPPPLPPPPLKFNPLEFDSTEVNDFYVKRFEYWIQWIQNRSNSKGRHQAIYTVLMNLLPYVNQQTALSESELISTMERIVENLYGDRSEISALYRTIKKVREKTAGWRIENEMSKYRRR